MSQPGWYPDPAGQPGQFRYWDGARWGQQTTSNPQQPGGGFNQPSKGGGSGRIIGIIAVVLVLLLVGWLVVRGLGGSDGPGAKEDTNSSTPTVSGWDETSTPTPTPTPSDPDSSGGSMVNCPNGGGNRGGEVSDRLRSGRLSVERLGWQNSFGFSPTFAYDIASETKQITSTWFSVSAVGQLHTSDGFTNPKTSAIQALSCFGTSGYYQGMTGKKNIESKAVTIDGHPGWFASAEVYVDDQGPNIPGDLIEVVVVDVGDPDNLGIYMSSATIGDQQTIAEITKARESLKFES